MPRDPRRQRVAKESRARPRRLLQARSRRFRTATAFALVTAPASTRPTRSTTTPCAAEEKDKRRGRQPVPCRPKRAGASCSGTRHTRPDGRESSGHAADADRRSTAARAQRCTRFRDHARSPPGLATCASKTACFAASVPIARRAPDLRRFQTLKRPHRERSTSPKCHCGIPPRVRDRGDSHVHRFDLDLVHGEIIAKPGGALGRRRMIEMDSL